MWMVGLMEYWSNGTLCAYTRNPRGTNIAQLPTLSNSRQAAGMDDTDRTVVPHARNRKHLLI